MKSIINRKTNLICFLLGIIALTSFSSCEKKLEAEVFDQFASNSFYANGADAKAALTNVYRGMLNSGWAAGWGASNGGWNVQSAMTTDELVCSWGWPGWKQWNDLQFYEDFGEMTTHYTGLMPTITTSTIVIDKIQGIEMDEALKSRYTAELKALRAHYSQVLYGLYGPVPIRIDPKEASDPSAQPIERPTAEWMVAQIKKDYTEAASVLPTSYPAAEYGRFTKGAALMGLLKLAMKEKNWQEAISLGRQLQGLENEGIYSLMTNYDDIFKIQFEQNKEIILGISCLMNNSLNFNAWLAMSLPGAYTDPSGKLYTAWGGYKMPWATYDKFSSDDKRLKVLLESYPGPNNTLINARTTGEVGAIPIKYGGDPTATSELQGTDIIVWRYADALLLLAEAINEQDGPTQEAHDLLNRIRTRAGLSPYTGLTKDAFRNKIKDERLFELWAEGTRRDDMIRWGDYIKRAIDAGSTFAKPEFVLYPLPRKVINETNGLVKQNPGY